MPLTRSKSRKQLPHSTIDNSNNKVPTSIQHQKSDVVSLSNNICNEIPHDIDANTTLSPTNEISSLPHSNEWDELTNTPVEHEEIVNNPSLLSTTNVQTVLESPNIENKTNEEVVSQQKFSFPQNAIILPYKYNSYAKLKDPQAGYSYTKDNYKLYGLIVNSKEALNYYKSLNKKGFIINFIDDNFKNKVVFEYNEDHKKYMPINNSRLNEVIKKRFDNLKGKFNIAIKKGTRKLPPTSNIPIGYDELGVDLPFQMREKHKGSICLRKFYTSLYCNNILLTGHYKWNYYSMFHSLYQSFSTVLYNSSHKLDDNTIVHRCSRVKLNFPENANCSLIIHGRLVHSGAQSKTETKMSFNTSHDARLHAYLYNVSSRSELNNVYENHKKAETVDTSTFKLCNSNCPTCEKYRKLLKKDNIEYQEINIQDYIDYDNECRFKNQRTSYEQHATHKLLGDFDELGWEVWTGLDTSLSKYQDLQKHLKILVVGRGKSLWSGISSTKRKVLKIDKLLGEETQNVNESLIYMTTVFDDIIKNILKYIPQLGDNVSMGTKAVLCNFGELDEQRAHRDFSSKKKNVS